MSLYLQYRPKTLGDMVWQRHIIDVLLAQAQQEKFSSSYLLYGPRGTWKTSTARLLAKMVNSTTKDADGNPDVLTDPAAMLIDQWKTLDYVEIDAASHTWVDNIREEIIDKALYPPTNLKTKVYVIDEVHMLSKGAFNALLKIMEEPKPYLMFVLATTEINKVPDTIISRCQVFNFKHLSIDEIVWRLEHIAWKESMEYDGEALRLIARLSNWAMRDAIKYLEQVSILWPITQENVAQFLWVVSANVLQEFMNAIASKNYDAVVKILDWLVDWGTDLYALAKDILLYLDDHFMENPAAYAPLTWMMQEIAAEMKRYPHPALVWKRKLYMYCSGWWVAVETASVVSQPVEKSPASAVESVSTPEPVVQTEKEVLKTPVVSPPVEASVPVPIQSPSSQDFSWILEKIIEKVDKVMIRSALKQQTMIESFNDWVLSMIIINEQFYTIMQKQETVEYLNNIVSQVVWTPTVIAAKYMSKEDFMKQAL